MEGEILSLQYSEANGRHSLSVLLGAVFLASHTVSADTIEVKQNEPTLEKTSSKLDTVTKASESTEHTQPNVPMIIQTSSS